MNNDLKTLENEFKDVQNKQQQRIIHSASLQLNLTATTNNLANKLESLKNEFNTVQNKQEETISRDINILQSNLTATTNNLANIFAIFDSKLNSTQEKQLKLSSKVTDFTEEFKLIDQQIENVQQKQIELSHLSEENDHKIISMSKNINDGLNRLDKKLNYTQEKQLELTFDLRSHGHADIDQLTSQIKNFKNDFKLIDQQIGTVQQKQFELSRLSKENDQKRNAISTKITDGMKFMNRLDEKLNSTQEKQLELTSDVRGHGHGNKQRIDQLTSQITKFTSDFEVFDEQVKTVQQQQAKLISKDDLLDRRMNVLWTNITFYMNQIERQAFENITDLSSHMNSTTKKIDVLWINLLNSRDMIVPLLENFTFYGPAADIIEMRNTGRMNVTSENAIRSAIDEIDLDEVEFKRIVTDLTRINRIQFEPNDIKLHPIDSNLKKVKHSSTVESFARNKLYLTSGSFDGEA